MFEELTPAKKGLILMMFLFIIAAGLFTGTYLPYNQYRKIENNCTQTSTGTVVSADEIQSDGVFFYGPMIEYTEENMLIRANAINTVDPKKQHTVGETVEIAYDPYMRGDLILPGDATIKTRFMFVSIACIAMLVTGIAAVIVGIVKSSDGPEIKTYFLNKDGHTFEQWQELQKLKEQAQQAEGDLEEKVSLDKDSSDSGEQ